MRGELGVDHGPDTSWFETAYPGLLRNRTVSQSGGFGGLLEDLAGILGPFPPVGPGGMQGEGAPCRQL